MATLTSPVVHADGSREPDYLNEQKGLLSWLTTVDHKRIGVMYLWSVLAAFLLGGLFAMAVRLELLTPAQDFMTAETYNKVFTLHGAIMVFLFIIPAIPAALGNFVLPLMLGAKDVAFPRLNLASYYVYMAGAIMAVTAMVTGGVDTGWTFYTQRGDDDARGVCVGILLNFHGDQLYRDCPQIARPRHGLV